MLLAQKVGWRMSAGSNKGGSACGMVKFLVLVAERCLKSRVRETSSLGW